MYDHKSPLSNEVTLNLGPSTFWSNLDAAGWLLGSWKAPGQPTNVVFQWVKFDVAGSSTTAIALIYNLDIYALSTY